MLYLYLSLVAPLLYLTLLDQLHPEVGSHPLLFLPGSEDPQGVLGAASSLFVVSASFLPPFFLLLSLCCSLFEGSRCSPGPEVGRQFRKRFLREAAKIARNLE